MKKVVVIGGGFAGVMAAKKLENHFEVTLIDDKDYFEFTPAVLRTLVEPKKINKIQILHNHYLRKSGFTFGLVKKIYKNKITVKDLKKQINILFDYLIIASGSEYNSPIKEQYIIQSTRAEELRNSFKKFSESTKIIVIGGGLAGVELAAEIAKYPDKEITLVHAKENLIERLPKKASDYVKKYLEKRKVKIIFNERVTKRLNAHFITDKGTKLKADMAFLCTGITPKSGFIGKRHVNEKGHIMTGPYFKTQLGDNIFAIGDVTDIGEEKTAQSAIDHAKLLAKNLIHQENKQYFTKPKPIIISLGKYNGILAYKNFIITGILPAIAKSFVEKMFMINLRYF